MKKQLITVAVIISIFAACKQNDPTPASEIQTAASANLQQEEGAGLTPQGASPNAKLSASVRIYGDACGTTANVTNCVKYSRCRKTLPSTDLTYFEVLDKKGNLIGGKRFIINSSTALVGAAAIIKTSAVWGHIAIVQKVSGTTITIRETNWAGAYVSERSGTASELKIAGYRS